MKGVRFGARAGAARSNVLDRSLRVNFRVAGAATPASTRPDPTLYGSWWPGDREAAVLAILHPAPPKTVTNFGVRAVRAPTSTRPRWLDDSLQITLISRGSERKWPKRQASRSPGRDTRRRSRPRGSRREGRSGRRVVNHSVRRVPVRRCERIKADSGNGPDMSSLRAIDHVDVEIIAPDRVGRDPLPGRV